jgi:casein kinase II subunit beta
MPGVDTVKLFCPNCNDIYTPSSSRFSGVDGAFFGTTFAHLFFHTYREYCPAPFVPGRNNRAPPSPTGNHTASPPPASSLNNGGQQINPNQYGGQKRPETRVYVPRIYGFKVSERAKSGPRMAWLRLRPPTFEDLDAVDSRGRWVQEKDSDEEDGDDGQGRRGRFDDVRPYNLIFDGYFAKQRVFRMTTQMNRLKKTKKMKKMLCHRLQPGPPKLMVLHRD